MLKLNCLFHSEKEESDDMKKTIFLIMTVLMIMASASAALAHPPRNFTMRWDAASEVLTVKADHKVSNPGQHYVMSIYITADGETIFQKRYEKQSSPDFYSDNISLKGIKKGTKITATISCNIMGASEATLVID